MSLYQEANGCSTCEYAGNYTHSTSIAPALSDREYEALRSSGANYYCVKLRKPVWSDYGKTCSEWFPDQFF